ncbi:GNAT family N-acetyltransferase [Streptomyces sp. NPDC021093]|uniref:GNAT family N-acetyltransferase n=1 Tax=Streptomyces sp. NPDC021093 TaxID=3365112 RepID=UPI003798DF69
MTPEPREPMTPEPAAPPTSERTLIAVRTPVALTRVTRDDMRAFAAARDNAYEVDPDPRPLPITTPTDNAAVVDSGTGRLYGLVGWHAVSHGSTHACLAWNVGLAMLPTARGQGVGVTALRLVVEHLFATTDFHRIEAATDVDNIAARRTAESAGFHHEGTLRGAQLRDGRRRDLMTYSLLRSDL